MKWTMVAALAVSGCGSSGFNRQFDYPGHSVGNFAVVPTSAGRNVTVKYHERGRDPTILLRAGVGAEFLGALASDLSLGLMEPADALGLTGRVWREAATTFFDGSGCQVLDVYHLFDAVYEAVYDCPDGSTPPVIGGKWRAVVRPADPAPVDPAG